MMWFDFVQTDLMLKKNVSMKDFALLTVQNFNATLKMMIFGMAYVSILVQMLLILAGSNVNNFQSFYVLNLKEFGPMVDGSIFVILKHSMMMNYVVERVLWHLISSLGNNVRDLKEKSVPFAVEVISHQNVRFILHFVVTIQRLVSVTHVLNVKQQVVVQIVMHSKMTGNFHQSKVHVSYPFANHYLNQSRCVMSGNMQPLLVA
mmetsp:Transcript_5454/g.8329  ORF Transcript_5454/g.8329 Transcript_5454/m.8329 type:complete len:204 (+) Transcript_5454:1106-1717(+)